MENKDKLMLTIIAKMLHEDKSYEEIIEMIDKYEKEVNEAIEKLNPPKSEKLSTLEVLPRLW